MFRLKSNSDAITLLAANAISAKVMVADENIVDVNAAITGKMPFPTRSPAARPFRGAANPFEIPFNQPIKFRRF